MLRITQSPAVHVTTINLEGKLLSPWVEEVRTAVAAARSHGRVALNLAKLQFADHVGAAFLRELRADGVELLRGSPFIEGLLAAGSTR